jgi:CPA2 family monovalent cation:H+ antiporter-2
MEQTHVLPDLGLLLLAALGGGAVAFFLRQPLIVGYILGGVLVSPFTPGPQVSNPQAFETFADIGVVLLMFSIGAEFSLEELLRVRKVVMVGAPAGIILIILLAFLVGWLLGWPPSQRLVLGASISVCSTMVLLKFLQDRGEVNSAHGRLLVGISLVGDLAVVAMIALMPALKPAAANQAGALLQALLRAAVILGPFFLLARQVVPGVLDRVAKAGDTELLVLVMMVLAIGTAILTAAAGFSLALGAFLAGLLVNEAESCHKILTRILAIRDIFVAIFFASIGLLIQPLFLASQAPTILILVVLVVVGNFWIWLGVVRAAGYQAETGGLAALGLTQIGEFSYVLAGTGLREGLIGAPVQQAILATSLITIVVNALVFRRTPTWLRRIVTGHGRLLTDSNT